MVSKMSISRLVAVCLLVPIFGLFIWHNMMTVMLCWLPKTMNFNNCSTAKKSKPRRRNVYFCITGQLSRLEMEYKMKNAIEPLLASGADVDIALVLSSTDRRSTQGTVEAGTFVGVDNVNLTSMLLEAGVRNVIMDDRPQPPNPLVNRRYVEALGAVGSLKQNLDKTSWESYAQNHVRQWDAMQRCWEHATAHHDKEYDLYIRMREDAIFYEPWSAEGQWSNGLHVPHCNGWNGFNDRLAVIVGHDEARKYFTLPMNEYYMRYDEVVAASSVNNPESFLYAVMLVANVTVHTECATRLPLISTHLTALGEVCIRNEDLDSNGFGTIQSRPGIHGGESCGLAEKTDSCLSLAAQQDMSHLPIKCESAA